MVGRNLVLIAVTGGSLRHEACDRHLMQNPGNLEYDVPRKRKVLAVDIDVIESETLLKLNPLALQFFLCETLALCQNSLVHKETEV